MYKEKPTLVILASDTGEQLWRIETADKKPSLKNNFVDTKQLVLFQ